MFPVHLFSKLIHKFIGIQHIMFLYSTKIYGLDISLLKNHINEVQTRFEYICSAFYINYKGSIF